MFKRSKVSTGVLLALGVAAAGSSFAQAAQRVEITGSSIKRLNAETAAPVQIIAREEIKATGANTVRQVLDTITATTSNELRDDGASTSFASGATGSPCAASARARPWSC